jgi:hypothetical protein
MSPLERQNRLFNVAVCLAPAFRDKYDFSGEKDYTDHASISFKAAEAFVHHDEEMRKTIADIQQKQEAQMSVSAGKIVEVK